VGKAGNAVLAVSAVLLLAVALCLASSGEADVADAGSGSKASNAEVAVDGTDLRGTDRVADNPVPAAGGPANRHASAETGVRDDVATSDETDGLGSAPDMPGRTKHLQFQLPDGRLLEESNQVHEWHGWKLEVITLGFEYGMVHHSLYGNHSEVLGEEEVEIGEYRATLALVERTPPAAAESDEPSWEYWLYVAEPVTVVPGYGYAYCLIVHADERSEEARQATLEIGSTLRLTPGEERQE
jgi:hypothetical protein